MSTLHVVFSAELPEALSRCWADGDALLLAGPCVLLAMHSATLPSPCFALSDSVQSRGLTTHWPEHIACITHHQWLELLAQHRRSLSWS